MSILCRKAVAKKLHSWQEMIYGISGSWLHELLRVLISPWSHDFYLSLISPDLSYWAIRDNFGQQR